MSRNSISAEFPTCIHLIHTKSHPWPVQEGLWGQLGTAQGQDTQHSSWDRAGVVEEEAGPIRREKQIPD